MWFCCSVIGGLALFALAVTFQHFARKHCLQILEMKMRRVTWTWFPIKNLLMLIHSTVSPLRRLDACIAFRCFFATHFRVWFCHCPHVKYTPISTLLGLICLRHFLQSGLIVSENKKSTKTKLTINLWRMACLQRTFIFMRDCTQGQLIIPRTIRM